MTDSAQATHFSADLRHRGRVVEFDADVGLGILAASGPTPREGSSFPFHCTQISDGSRTIEIGTDVSFSVVPGRLGIWEAASVTAVGAGPSA